MQPLPGTRSSTETQITLSGIVTLTKVPKQYAFVLEGDINPVPEPSTYAGLLGITCVSLLAYGWRRKRQQAA